MKTPLLIIILFLRLAALGSSATLHISEVKKYLYLVAHHKSGTRISRGHYSIICLDGDELTADKAVPLRGAAAENCPRVMLSTRGIDSSYDLRLINETMFVHYIRHPVDMLLSGYLYHKACNEASWTDSEDHPHKRYGLDFPLAHGSSFCKYLQHHSPEEGLRMELKRTLRAPDGIGKMLRDIGFLEGIGTPPGTPKPAVLNICEADYQERLPMIAQVLVPFGAAASRHSQVYSNNSSSSSSSKSSSNDVDSDLSVSLNADEDTASERLRHIPDEAAHHTDKGIQSELFGLAQTLVNEVIPPEVMQVFPCVSHFGMKDIPVAVEYITKRSQHMASNV